MDLISQMLADFIDIIDPASLHGCSINQLEFFQIGFPVGFSLYTLNDATDLFSDLHESFLVIIREGFWS